MLNEPFLDAGKAGWIEVICGGMFSGKTEAYERRARHCFRPSVDKRRRYKG